MGRKLSGFTLVEILVALMIFAIVGVLAAMSLRAMIRTHHALQKTDTQLLQLQITMYRLRQDIAQIINRPIIDSNDNIEAALVGINENKIIFTRTGVQNPLHISAKSNMQRVSYVLEKNKLLRLTWPVLDQAPDTKPESQVLLNHVQSVQWQFLTDHHQWVSFWPPANESNLQKENTSPLPKAIAMVMHIKNQGVVQGVFPIPARGFVNETATQWLRQRLN